jgi:twitching motility protein PilT
VTGPTGSGKSTTLASMIRHVNETRACHIVTMEDPIEFVHREDRAQITQREIGRDVKDFGAALRRAMRQDPDVLLVGEMRDLETIALAVTAAETGHLVFGTLHTTSASTTVERIVSNRDRFAFSSPTRCVRSARRSWCQRRAEAKRWRRKFSSRRAA